MGDVIPWILNKFLYSNKSKTPKSQVVIPIGNKKVKLEPEEKAKFIVLKSDDPKAQILYQELEFGNYTLFTEKGLDEQRDENQSGRVPNENKDAVGIWTLEFDGSYALQDLEQVQC